MVSAPHPDIQRFGAFGMQAGQAIQGASKMPEKTVLLAAMSLDYGGAETHVIDLASELVSSGWRVFVASQGGRLVTRLETIGIPHVFVPLHSRSPVHVLSAVRMIRELASQCDVDVLHAHGRIPAWVSWQVQSQRKHIALVTTYHGVYASHFPWNLVTRQGDMSIAVSDDVKAHLEQNLRFDPVRVQVIPNGIDTMRFSPAPYPKMRSHFVARADTPLVLNVSRQDGPFAEPALMLAKALPILDKQFPGIVGLIVGDGDRLSEVRAACCEANKLLGRTAAIATGGQHDVVPYLQCADVVVGVARAALEAMACEKPVVFAGEGGFRGPLRQQNLDMLREHNFTARGSNTPVTPSALSEAISALLADRDAAKAAARAGRALIEHRYSWDVLTPEVLLVYEKALMMRSAMSGRRG